MKEIEKPWVEIGYRLFAYEGISGVRIERLSKEVAINKSSFYHLFADKDIFIEKLLAFHFNQANIIAEKELKSNNESELIEVILEHKIDLLFNRQLRVHRENQNFISYIDQINNITVPALLPVWKKIIGLSENTALAQMVLMLSLDNFYLQITYETLNENWLKSYFATIRKMILHFTKMEQAKSINGSV